MRSKRLITKNVDRQKSIGYFFFFAKVNYICLKENVAASNQIFTLIESILKILKEKHICVDFVVTIGDHKYNQLHDSFFEIIFNMYKSNMLFNQIIEKIAISDFLHLLKILRSNLVKYGLVTDNNN